MARPKRPRSKRVLILADTHTMHLTGLTPPAWHYSPARDEAAAAWHRETWAWFTRFCRDFGQPDLLIHVGDTLCLTDPQYGAGELVTADVHEGVRMACQCLAAANPRAIVMVRGTARHVTEQGTDTEDMVAKRVGAEIHDQAFLEINGHRINVRHHIGASRTSAAMLNEVRANREWAGRGIQPLADTFIRAHIHQARQYQEATWQGIQCPALQGWTRFGARRCVWPVDWGVAWGVIAPDGTATWHLVWQTLSCHAAHVLTY